MEPRPQIDIIGVGNAMRGDDGIGHEAVRRLRSLLPDSIDVRVVVGDGTTIMDAWQHSDFAIVVDAISTDGVPGTVYRLDAETERFPSDFFHYSSHAFSLAEAIEMARALGTLPSRLIVYGVEGSRFESGEGLSPQARAGVQVVVDRVAREVAEFLEEHRSERERDPASEKSRTP
jgi:hydrogenase maturation protease